MRRVRKRAVTETEWRVPRYWEICGVSLGEGWDFCMARGLLAGSSEVFSLLYSTFSVSSVGVVSGIFGMGFEVRVGS